MIRFQNISALFYKQFKDTLKNLPVLVLFLVYPCIAFVMTQAMKDAPGTESLFISMFATMHCVFTPMVSIASTLSEEKESNTLRVLIMSNVNLKEYFMSIGGFILIADLITGFCFLPLSRYSLIQSLQFLIALSIGCLISIVLGICIGLYAKNASAANGLAVPIGMVFAFLPMLSNFNKGIENISRFTYGQQISYLLTGEKLSLFAFIILIINTMLLVLLSALLFKKSLSED